jgi:hypothetical protein
MSGESVPLSVQISSYWVRCIFNFIMSMSLGGGGIKRGSLIERSKEKISMVKGKLRVKETKIKTKITAKRAREE